MVSTVLRRFAQVIRSNAAVVNGIESRTPKPPDWLKSLTAPAPTEAIGVDQRSARERALKAFASLKT
jgi:hypothetical protein